MLAISAVPLASSGGSSAGAVMPPTCCSDVCHALFSASASDNGTAPPLHEAACTSGRLSAPVSRRRKETPNTSTAANKAMVVCRHNRSCSLRGCLKRAHHRCQTGFGALADGFMGLSDTVWPMESQNCPHYSELTLLSLRRWQAVLLQNEFIRLIHAGLCHSIRIAFRQPANPVE